LRRHLRLCRTDHTLAWTGRGAEHGKVLRHVACGVRRRRLQIAGEPGRESGELLRRIRVRLGGLVSDTRQELRAGLRRELDLPGALHRVGLRLLLLLLDRVHRGGGVALGVLAGNVV